ncbi:MAG: class I SAM-dependent methyltransferase [Saprospiraceae bacterium]
MSNTNYNPEDYWSTVGQRIENRQGNDNVVAGDDEPYYRYKRQRFLELLKEIDFSQSSVLEVGSGPGGNLKVILDMHPKKLAGADISSQMVKLARSILPSTVEIVKTNGIELPFESGAFNIIFTSTVLQHNTDEKMLKSLMKDIARLKPKKIYFFERIENDIIGDELCLGRPVQYYADIMQSNNYILKSTSYSNIRVSYYVSGVIRKVFNKPSRKEGEPISKLSYFLQNITLSITKHLDTVFKSKKDLARLEFELN